MISKYALNSVCDWCGDSPAKPLHIQTNGVKTKRYTIAASACDQCERRLTKDQKDDAHA